MRKKFEAIRIEPLSIISGTGACTGAGIGSTDMGGAVDVSKGIGDFSVLVGGYLGATSSISAESATTAKYVQFTVREATAATHVGSAITGATLTLGAATAGTIRGAYDVFVAVASALNTSVGIKINGYEYHNTALHAGAGTAAAIELANHINGLSTLAGTKKLPHYKAHISTVGVFAGTTGMLYICPDDDQATGLTIEMSAVTDTVVPYMKRLQGVISVNGHALSTNTPKFINVSISTYAGDTSHFYSFLLRDGNRTPGAVTDLNT